MKVHLLSCDLNEIAWAESSGLIDAVATTPVLLAGTGGFEEARAKLAEICRATSLAVTAAVPAIDRSDLYAAGRELAKISDSIVVQLPMLEDALIPARKLAQDGIRIGITLVFTAPQAVLAAKLGAAMVSTETRVMRDLGSDAEASLMAMSQAFREYGMSCDVFAVSPEGAAEVSSCMASGVDGIVVDAATLKKLLVHPSTDRGLDRLLQELSQIHRARVSH